MKRGFLGYFLWILFSKLLPRLLNGPHLTCSSWQRLVMVTSFMFIHLDTDRLSIDPYICFVIGKPLAVLTTFLFDRLDFFSILNLPRAQFCRFMTLLESGYLDVPYHNNLHAADVVHNTFWMFQSPQLASSLSRLDMAVALLAGAMHDYGLVGLLDCC